MNVSIYLRCIQIFLKYFYAFSKKYILQAFYEGHMCPVNTLLYLFIFKWCILYIIVNFIINTGSDCCYV